LKLILASSISVIAVAYLAERLDLDGNIVALVGVLSAASLIYLLVARVMRIEEVGQTIKVLLRR
jgi:hypothetical protein